MASALPRTLYAAVHEPALGTALTKSDLALCPQLAKADIGWTAIRVMTQTV